LKDRKHQAIFNDKLPHKVILFTVQTTKLGAASQMQSGSTFTKR